MYLFLLFDREHLVILSLEKNDATQNLKKPHLTMQLALWK